MPDSDVALVLTALCSVGSSLRIEPVNVLSTFPTAALPTGAAVARPFAEPAFTLSCTMRQQKRTDRFDFLLTRKYVRRFTALDVHVAKRELAVLASGQERRDQQTGIEGGDQHDDDQAGNRPQSGAGNRLAQRTDEVDADTFG